MTCEHCGELTLYHRTTPEAAAEILRTGVMYSQEYDKACYFSTRTSGYALDYGEAVIIVHVPAEIAELDDEFGDGELHYRVNARDLRREHFALAPPETIAADLLARFRESSNTGEVEERAVALVSHIEATGALPAEWRDR